jgi:hypothetical protein
VRLPLYLACADGRTVTLARCPNCGEVKIASEPCGFDHLAALLEWQQAALEAWRKAPTGRCPEDCTACYTGEPDDEHAA